MRPAYLNALTAGEKRLIGDLVATHSQIDLMMAQTVRNLLEIEEETAAKIMGSTNIRTNADIWLAVVQDKNDWEGIEEWAEWAHSEMAVLAKTRNDFAHSVFGFADDDPTSTGFWSLGHYGWGDLKTAERVAQRVKTAAPVAISYLKEAVARAAYLSVAVAHIDWVSRPDAEYTPWFRRLGGRLPPPKGSWGRQSARGR